MSIRLTEFQYKAQRLLAEVPDTAARGLPTGVQLRECGRVCRVIEQLDRDAWTPRGGRKPQ